MKNVGNVVCMGEGFHLLYNADLSSAAANDTLASRQQTRQIGISAFIMTLNEEVNIGRCLDALQWCNDVVVLDSYSTDRTVVIAQAFQNVRIQFRKFDDYSRQRNFGLHEIRYRNPWLLIVDADEVVGEELVMELSRATSGPGIDDFDVFLLRRKVILDDRVLLRNLQSEFWLPRLVRPLAVRFRGAVHERLEYDGGCGRLAAKLDHRQFDKGIDDWFFRRSEYARLETEDYPAPPIRFSQLTSADPLLRRATVKAIFYRLPARWVAYFLYSLLVKRSFLDGRTGIKYLILETKSQFRAVQQKRRSS